MPDPTRPLDDLIRLGLPPGASPDALKPAWRRAVSALHPDRNGPQSDRELAEVNAAFQRLQAFVQRHGRLPGHPESTWRPPQPPRHSASRWMVATLAIAAAFVVLWPQPRPPEPHSADDELVDEQSDNPSAAASTLGADIGRPPDRLRVGLKPEEVEHLAGPPMFRSAERWEYGPSEVRFANGRVSGWYSSALRPLPVGDTPSFPASTGH